MMWPASLEARNAIGAPPPGAKRPVVMAVTAALRVVGEFEARLLIAISGHVRRVWQHARWRKPRLPISLDRSPSLVSTFQLPETPLALLQKGQGHIHRGRSGGVWAMSVPIACQGRGLCVLFAVALIAAPAPRQASAAVGRVR